MVLILNRISMSLLLLLQVFHPQTPRLCMKGKNTISFQFMPAFVTTYT